MTVTVQLNPQDVEEVAPIKHPALREAVLKTRKLLGADSKKYEVNVADNMQQVSVL